jgi:hypothetical protein
VIGLGGGAGPLVFTPSGLQNLAATSTIASSSAVARIATANPTTLTSNPQIAAGLNGQKITVVNEGALSLTLVNGNGLLMPQNRVLYGGQNVSFTYSSQFSSWVMDGGIPESAVITGAPTVPLPAWNTDSQQIAPTGFVYDHLYDHNLPGWRALTLTANWVNLGATWGNLSIKRIGRDMIAMRGVIAVSGSFSGTIIAAGASGLPADCRPPVRLILPANSPSDTIRQVDINPDGSVITYGSLAVGQYLGLNLNWFI